MLWRIEKRPIAMSTQAKKFSSRKKGFTRTSTLLSGRIRDVSASRGFAQSRLLTHWEETVGPDIAKIARPVEVSYGGKGGFGATLVLLTTGANAPILEMEKEKLRARVNAVYGYAAISRIRVTQTAPVGFADGKVAFEHATPSEPKGPSKEAQQAAAQEVAPVADDGLRAALERLGANIISKSNN